GHLTDAINAGADAVLAASIFHYREYTVGEVKQELADHGIEVRL
ncbi:MAG: imidazole glycerol phosphate synthase subunit HisF, partial [Alphaproteobacteria bacterium]